MNFGIIMLKDQNGLSPYSPRCWEITGDKDYLKTGSLERVRGIKEILERDNPDCSYQIVEYDSMKKPYGVKCVKGIDHSSIKEKKWEDDFVLLSKENAYASTDLAYIAEMSARMTETWKNSGKYVYKVWDIDLDREVFDLQTPQSNKNFTKLIDWLRS